ncbi:family 43 glycosylhydrolase [Streptomyces fuscichromogenes]|uniref:family 43 glycosylhydrolase n=1 Tax=Streptomyces fuscichromogenes TaxID=1324013 RepID=UPI00380D9BD5
MTVVMLLLAAMAGPLVGAPHAVAAVASKTVTFKQTTTVRGTPDLTYYACPAGSQWDFYPSLAWGPDGCSFEITFTGHTVELFGRTRTGHGSGNVFIDGSQVGTVNYGTSTNNTTRLLFTKAGLPDTTHTLRLVVVGSGVDHSSAVFESGAPDGSDALDLLCAQVRDYTKADYTSASWSPFVSALATAQVLVDNNTGTQAERGAAESSLRSASKALVEVGGLREILADYETRTAAAYTSTSWQPFAAARSTASTVVADSNASAGAVVAAKNALLSAAASLVTTSPGEFTSIRNDSFWTDTDGHPIYSQGGGVFRFGDTYYWYGVHYAGAETYAANPKARTTDTAFVSIPVYSSKDLSAWKYEGDVASTGTPLHIPASMGTGFAQMSSLADASWLGRLGVSYSENTGKFVLSVQMNETRFPDADGQNGVLFLQSDSPTGSFRFANIQRQITNVPTRSTGDQTVFTDDDGKDYLVFSNSSGRNGAYVSALADADNLSVEPAVRIGFNASGREGNAMFRLGDSYYMAASDLHGWNASATHVIRSQTSAIQGTYGSEFVLPGTEPDYSHVTQTGFFITVHGTKNDLVIYSGDRWADFAGNGIGYNQWMPITGSGDALRFHSLSDWQLNAVTGEWKVGKENNYVLNPSFEADRVAVSPVQGWTYSGTTSAIVNQGDTNGRVGNFHLAFTSPTQFSAGASQDVTLPDGVYDLTATIRNGVTGAAAAAAMSITSGGRTTSADLTQQSSNWSQVTIPHVRVCGGAAQIRFSATDVPGGQWLNVDDVSLVATAS